MPWKLVHKEEYDNMADARKREKYLKSAAGRRYLVKVLSEKAGDITGPVPARLMSVRRGSTDTCLTASCL